jgi:hypothetical protein
VTADRHHLRFYVDESALGLGKALESARKDTIHAGHKLIPECPLGALDPDLSGRLLSEAPVRGSSRSTTGDFERSTSDA